jgi:para-aminobenzoate synthetase component I
VISNIYNWQKRSLPEGTTGAQVWEALFVDESTTVLLESPASVLSKISRYSIVAGKPIQVWLPPVGEILPCLRELQIQARSASPSKEEVAEDGWDNLPFVGGYLGWLGYDLAWEIEKLPYLKPDTLPFPVAFWYEPECFAVVDHQEHVVWLAASDRTQLQALNQKLSQTLDAQMGERQKELERMGIGISYLGDRRYEPKEVIFSPDADTYTTMVLQAQKHIYAGDIFQANLSLRFGTRCPIDGWQLYKQLQRINPSPFASYWRTQWGEVISASPERLVQLRGDHIETRPIAGTRPRGKDPQADLAQAEELLACAKEQAEHIMLVDLERNDLGRVCEWGSVDVDELLVIERYSHVMHIVSNVIGQLKSDRNAIDLIKAVFPGGTITGCPKVRCMEIIETLEPHRRSLFYGSCGYIDRRGHMDLNILIRTLLKCGDRIWGQVGAGIVADSLPDREWQESLQKAQAQLAALKLR